MQIRSLFVQNYKVFETISLKEISDVSYFIGANGTGKSTIFDIFQFLKDALQTNVKTALDHRGGYHEVVSRGKEGPIKIAFLASDQVFQRDRYIIYQLEIEGRGNEIHIKERVHICHGNCALEKEVEFSSFFEPNPEKRWESFESILDFQNGQGNVVSNEAEWIATGGEPIRESQSLDGPHILALKAYGQLKQFPSIATIRKFIEGWHFSIFESTSVEKLPEANPTAHLSKTGDNLASVAYHLYQNHPDIFQVVLNRLRESVPGVEKVEPQVTKDNRILLLIKDSSLKKPFRINQVSGGTLRMFAYLIMLYNPSPHPLLCIEEPENDLYYSLLQELSHDIFLYTQRGGQVFVATHSPDLINAASPKQVFWLTKKDGFSQVNWVADDPIVRNLVKQGDQIGYLWKQDFLGGSNP